MSTSSAVVHDGPNSVRYQLQWLARRTARHPCDDWWSVNRSVGQQRLQALLLIGTVLAGCRGSDRISPIPPAPPPVEADAAPGDGTPGLLPATSLRKTIDLPGVTWVRAHRNRVLVDRYDEGHEYRLVDLRTGEPGALIRTVRPPRRPTDPVRGRFVFSSGLLVDVTRPGEAVARDEHGAVTWRFRAREHGPDESGLGATTVLRQELQPHDGVVLFYGLNGVDAATGEVIWRQPVETYGWRYAHLGGVHLFVPTDEGQLLAIDSSDGRIVWRRPHDPYGPMAADSRTLAMERNGEVILLDNASGRETARFQVPPVVSEVREMALGGDTLVLGDESAGLYGIDLGTGAVRWSAPLRATWIEAHDREVFLCTDGGFIHVLHGATGESRWSHGIGECGRGLGGGRGFFGVVPDADRGPAIVANVRGGVFGFARTTRPAAREPVVRAVVSGRALVNSQAIPGLKVWVGDHAATTDDKGRFRASFEGRGRLRIQIDMEAARRHTKLECGHVVPEIVDLRGTKAAIPVELNQPLFPLDADCGGCRCE